MSKLLWPVRPTRVYIVYRRLTEDDSLDLHSVHATIKSANAAVEECVDEFEGATKTAEESNGLLSATILGSTLRVAHARRHKVKGATDDTEDDDDDSEADSEENEDEDSESSEE